MKTKFFIVLFFICIAIIVIQWSLIKALDRRHKSELLLYNVAYIWCNEFDVTKYTLAVKECGKYKGHKEYGITTSGRRAFPGSTVATDPKVVPTGSLLISDDGKFYRAEDTGRKIKGFNIDIYVGVGSESNVKLANEWGKQKRFFFVIEPMSGGI
jgi:3D (Asp-Asp-Asp) domain-containing protein